MYFADISDTGRATRAAVDAWGLDLVCEEPTEYSNTVTAVFMPQGYSADALRADILSKFDMSLGAGLSQISRQSLSHRTPGTFQRL